MGIRLLAGRLGRGETSREQVIGTSLQRAKQPSAQGVFVSLHEQVLEQARELDKQQSAGKTLPPLAGIPLTLKDLFGVRGEQTCAGSVVLKNRAPVEPEDAEVVGHLRHAGLLFLGRVAMSEFAFSGMGLNPHYPLLHSVWDRETGRLPGGSSSGTAVSVALDIVPASLGSDTAGSCRIPAAFNGIVGLKPSHGRLSLQGIYPLSPSADAPGPLAHDVDSCFLLEQLMQGKALDALNSLPQLPKVNGRDLCFWIPESQVMDELDDEVSRAFDQAVLALQDAGVRMISAPLTALDDCLDMFFKRNTASFEVWQHHKALIETHADEYDPYVASRIQAGQAVTQQEQQKRYAEKAQLVQDVRQAIKGKKVDALLYPTVACIPPTVASTRDPEQIGQINMRCLRNTSTVNYFDGCSISLPCHVPGSAPVGLMLSSYNGQDDGLLAVAAWVETVLADLRKLSGTSP